jgi:hypothetical protein
MRIAFAAATHPERLAKKFKKLLSGGRTPRPPFRVPGSAGPLLGIPRLERRPRQLRGRPRIRRRPVVGESSVSRMARVPRSPGGQGRCPRESRRPKPTALSCGVPPACTRFTRAAPELSEGGWSFAGAAVIPSRTGSECSHVFRRTRPLVDALFRGGDAVVRSGAGRDVP